jgi:hypothetical protein
MQTTSSWGPRNSLGLMMIHWEIVASSGKQAGVSYGPHLGTMEFLGAHVSVVRGASRLEQSGPQSVAWLRCGLRGASRAVQSCTTASPLRAACTPPRWSTPSKKRKRPETGHQGPPGRAIELSVLANWWGGGTPDQLRRSSHWRPHVLAQATTASKNKLYFVCLSEEAPEPEPPERSLRRSRVPAATTPRTSVCVAWPIEAVKPS